MRFFLTAFILLSYLHGNAQQWEKAKAFGNLPKNENYPHVSDQQGNIYLIGQFNQQLLWLDNTMFYTEGNLEMFMTKLDSNFNVVWAKRYKNKSNITVTGMTQDNNGDIIICGSYSQTLILGIDTLKSIGSNDFFLAKLDTFGNAKWAKSGGSYYSETSGQIYCDKNNFIYVNGSFGNSAEEHTKPTAKFGNFNLTSFGVGDIFVAQYSTEGEVKWVKNFGSYSGDGAQLFLNGEDIYLSGGSDWQFHYDNSYFQDKESSTLGFILKMGINGNVHWVNGAVLINFGTMGLSDLIVDSHKNTYVTGGLYCAKYDCRLKFENKYIYTNEGQKQFIAKLDNEGQVVWLKVFEMPHYFYPEKFIYLNDNHFVLNYRNEIYEVDSNIKPKDFSKVKVEDYMHSSDLNIIRDGKLTIVSDYTLGPLKLGEIILPKPDVAYSMYVARANFIKTLAGINNEYRTESINVYPNPAEKYINIDLPKKGKGIYTFKIYSVQGQLIEDFILQENLILDIDKYNSGLYLFVFSNGKETETHKISVQH